MDTSEPSKPKPIQAQSCGLKETGEVFLTFIMWDIIFLNASLCKDLLTYPLCP